MPEDSTRKLLKVFGVSVTNCEDALDALAGAIREPSAGTAPVAALEAYSKAAGELALRWAEVSRLMFDYQTRALSAVESYLRARGGES
jgi:hypothetical protein